MYSECLCQCKRSINTNVHIRTGKCYWYSSRRLMHILHQPNQNKSQQQTDNVNTAVHNPDAATRAPSTSTRQRWHCTNVIVHLPHSVRLWCRTLVSTIAVDVNNKLRSTPRTRTSCQSQITLHKDAGAAMPARTYANSKSCYKHVTLQIR